MRRMIAVTLIGVALAGGAAACGSAGGAPSAGLPAGSPAHGTAQVLTVMRQISRCVRSHGVPGFPDPIINPLTNYPDFPQSAPHIPASAQQACRSLFNQLPPQAGASHPPTAQNMRALLRFARCMRARGLTGWPDPNSLGQFPIVQKSQAVRSALIACTRLVPGGSTNLQFVQAPGGGNG